MAEYDIPYRSIPIKHQRLGLHYAIVDIDYYDWLMSFTWQLHVYKEGTNELIYAQTHLYKIKPDNSSYRTTKSMHQLVLLAKLKLERLPSGYVTYHVIPNGLYNTRSNLELRTIKDNARYRRHVSDNTSGHRGVHWAAKYQK